MKTEGLPVTAVVERVNRISFASPLVVKLVDNFGARVNLGIKKKKEREKIGKVWIGGSIDTNQRVKAVHYEYTSTGCSIGKLRRRFEDEGNNAERERDTSSINSQSCRDDTAGSILDP